MHNRDSGDLSQSICSQEVANRPERKCDHLTERTIVVFVFQCPFGRCSAKSHKFKSEFKFVCFDLVGRLVAGVRLFVVTFGNRDDLLNCLSK